MGQPPTPPQPPTSPPLQPTSVPITYDDIEPTLRTGDVMFFHGTGDAAKQIEGATHSEFSHAAMIIRPDPAKPPFIWESDPAEIEPDFFTKTKHAGAQLSYLRESLMLFGPAYTAYVRHLNFPRTPEFETVAMWATLCLDGTPFPALEDILEQWQEGGKHLTVPDTSFFCSELVAHTLMMMGLLPFDPPANSYAPGTFSNETPEPPWLRGASLGPQYRLEPFATAAPPASPS